MIASVRGTVLAVAASAIVVEVGGVGFAVQVTPQFGVSVRAGQEVTLHTALIVREDELSLYGFATRDELEVFDLLRGVSGVGPKSALGVLAALTPAEIAAAVAADDDAAFRRVSGIGPKTAKLITVSLAGKLLPPAGAADSAPAARDDVTSSVVAALVGLGWNERVAAQAVQEVIEAADDADGLAVPALLRLALGRLGPRVETR